LKAKGLQRLATITAGWSWLTVAYVLPTLMGAGMFFVIFVAGCHEPSHPIAPSLFGICRTGGAGEIVRIGTSVVLITIWVCGLALSIPAAVRHRRSPRGSALASTLAIATAVAVVVGTIQWAVLPAPFSIFGYAAIAGLCALVAGSITAGLTRPREQDDVA
jgi:hypothetical protein